MVIDPYTGRESLPWEMDPPHGPRHWTDGVTQAELDARKADKASAELRAAVALERIADALEELVSAAVAPKE